MGADVLVRATRKIEVDQSYRVARALGLFNVATDDAATFEIEADIPIEDSDWRIGVVYGPSGSGKSTIAATLKEHGWTEWGVDDEWPADKAIIDCIAPSASFDVVTAALASVGLGTVPSWLRPFHVLSNGERFRAELARLLAGDVTDVFIDEFTSVVDRRVACIGAQAFAKSWRRGPDRRVVLITPHQDVLAWVKPDWIVKTSLARATYVTPDYEAISPEVNRSAYGEPVFEVTA